MEAVNWMPFRNKPTNQRTNMKISMKIATVVTALLLAAAPISLMAQSAACPGCKGNGYGGPPKTEEERAARQAACLEKNGGVCPKGGPQANCPAGGKGKAAGKGARKGLRDGTGPRAGSGTCPLNSAGQASK